ncbi:hypothetical protein HZH68_004365 [Vespula germanica]|uniref:Uncharacterized protein n=1 Tax=Vespula germanica TaxID=30212 RepID=A0A834NJC3_VESGE|nr:hypothetical protein HZH68_004365 [Vespula germanica]
MTSFPILREDLIRLIDSPDVSRKTKEPFVGFDVGKEIETDKTIGLAVMQQHAGVGITSSRKEKRMRMTVGGERGREEGGEGRRGYIVAGRLRNSAMATVKFSPAQTDTSQTRRPPCHCVCIIMLIATEVVTIRQPRFSRRLEKEHIAEQILTEQIQKKEMEMEIVGRGSGRGGDGGCGGGAAVVLS